MSEQTTATLSPEQTGEMSIVYADAATPRCGNQLWVAAFRFDLDISQSTRAFHSFTLNLTINETASGGGAVQIQDGDLYALQAWVLKSPTSDPFDQPDLQPSRISTVALSDIVPGKDHPLSSTWVCAGFTSSSSVLDVSETQTISFGTARSDPAAGGNVYDLNFHHYGIQNKTSVDTPWSVIDWEGDLHVAVFADTSSNNPAVIDAATLSVSSVPWFTGLQGGRVGSRAVQDMKTGLPKQADELVEDGYKPGIWTVSEQADPDDPRNIRPTPLPPNEGVRDDDVPT